MGYQTPISLAALDEAEDVAIRVSHCGDARAAADVLRLTSERGASLLYLDERGFEVGYTDVGHRCSQTLLVTMGVKSDLDPLHIESGVEGSVGVGLGAEKGSVDSLGGVDVADGVDDRLQSVHTRLTYTRCGM